jgi:hypothetical protein
MIEPISLYRAECAARALEFRYTPTHYSLAITVTEESAGHFAVRVIPYEDLPIHRTLPKEIDGVPVRVVGAVK